jgi:hypothetical protein
MTNEPNIRFTSYGEDFTLVPVIDRYSNGRLAISMMYYDDEMDMYAPFAKVTVNMPEDHLNEGEVFVKDWSENAELVEFLVEQGWLTRTGREVLSGYVAPAVMRPAGPLADFVKVQ